ncbi:MAG TPA: adenylate/guanylate cyclase domain-containing protein [Thermoanaerobaculia bacterium]
MQLTRFRRGALLGLLCAAVVSLIYLIDPTLLGAEWWLFDRNSQLLAKTRRPDPRIVLVTVSESTARVLGEEFGRPQSYTRELYARAVDELLRDGAAVIAFDTLFAEVNETAPEGDRMLVESVRGKPVILAVQTQQASSRGAAAVPPQWAPKLWRVTGAEHESVHDLTLPMTALHEAAGIGSFRLGAGSTSARVHRYALVDRVSGGYVPSLALETARQYLKSERRASWQPALNEGRLAAASRSIPVDRGVEMLIRWNGGRTNGLNYPNVDLDKLLVASYAREEGGLAQAQELETFARQFRGKIVIIGITAAGLLDLRATPLSAQTAGIEIHANALDNLLNGDFNAMANRWLMLPAILLLGAAVGAAVDATRSQLFAGLIAVGVVLALAALGYAVLAGGGLVVPAMTAITATALTYITLTVVNFMAEQRQSAMLKTTFGRYVSPQILDHILAHPEKVQLGGERRELSILFSDIRGFTSISEASEPEEVVDMLNEYLTKMVDILLAHGGTLDKFIGDAVMGFWNAPAADPDHARNAVACAVEMVQETARLRERWVAEGKAELRIGVGINTGEAVAGNIGAERVFGYTVIGDAVNLASRLEGKNKDYVTEIIVSEFTLARIGDSFPTVYLDEVKVKGKDKAVKIYQVVV